jgi:hypothetical protein
MTLVTSKEVEASLTLSPTARTEQKIQRFLDFTRNYKDVYPTTRAANPKMIDNLFNSFTCHAVPGTALGFSTRY